MRTFKIVIFRVVCTRCYVDAFRNIQFYAVRSKSFGGFKTFEFSDGDFKTSDVAGAYIV